MIVICVDSHDSKSDIFKLKDKLLLIIEEKREYNFLWIIIKKLTFTLNFMSNSNARFILIF